mmetsp:Transcript_53110/g.153217  ORF Transcript_53110/g.153217 Transcript_53110/m.153217 type:complete len:218 (+) Transcript_53110:176-829(+)
MDTPLLHPSATAATRHKRDLIEQRAARIPATSSAAKAEALRFARPQKACVKRRHRADTEPAQHAVESDQCNGPIHPVGQENGQAHANIRYARNADGCDAVHGNLLELLHDIPRRLLLLASLAQDEVQLVSQNRLLLEPLLLVLALLGCPLRGTPRGRPFACAVAARHVDALPTSGASVGLSKPIPNALPAKTVPTPQPPGLMVHVLQADGAAVLPHR